MLGGPGRVLRHAGAQLLEDARRALGRSACTAAKRNFRQGRSLRRAHRVAGRRGGGGRRSGATAGAPVASEALRQDPGFRQQDLLGRQHTGAAEGSVASLGSKAKGEPRVEREVYRFSEVQAVVEAPVVGAGEGDDVLARPVHHPADLHPRLHQHLGRDHGRLPHQAPHGGAARHRAVSARRRPGAKHVRLDRGLHLGRVFGRRGVPRLRRSGVQEARAVQVVVLDVPRELREHHAQVEHGLVDPGQVLPHVGQDRVGEPGQAREVPRAPPQAVGGVLGEGRALNVVPVLQGEALGIPAPAPKLGLRVRFPELRARPVQPLLQGERLLLELRQLELLRGVELDPADRRPLPGPEVLRAGAEAEGRRPLPIPAAPGRPPAPTQHLRPGHCRVEGRHDLAHAAAGGLPLDAADVGHRVRELLWRGAEGRRFGHPAHPPVALVVERLQTPKM